MRRTLILLVLAFCVAPSITAASTWHRFSSKSLGFSVQFPSNWQLLNTPQLKQVQFQHPGQPVYSITVVVLPVKPGRSFSATMRQVSSYESRQGNSTFASIHWQSASIGGRAGKGGVLRPSTEGGVPLANGIYVLASRVHVYELTLVAFGKPAAHTLAQFPGIYRQILGTWRFL